MCRRDIFALECSCRGSQWAWTHTNATLRCCEKDVECTLLDKYGHIMTVLHQGDLSTATPTQILGKINVHEMYKHITPQKGSSSSKKKDLAFKASQEKKGKSKVKEVALDSSSDDEVDDANVALMVRKTTKMLKRLNKSGIKFDGKKKILH